MIANRGTDGEIWRAQDIENMGKVVLIGVGLLAVVIAGGMGFLSVWDIPAPTTHVEHVIPDARLAH